MALGVRSVGAFDLVDQISGFGLTYSYLNHLQNEGSVQTEI